MNADNRPALQAVAFVAILAALTVVAWFAAGRWAVFVPIVGVPLWFLARRAGTRATLASQGWSGRRFKNYWVYEEQQGKDRLSLSIRLRFVEPDRYVLVVPSAAEWRRTMPRWAVDRRAEILERVRESWAPDDVEWPPEEFAGGRRERASRAGGDTRS
jgi:hypothetical protein